MKNISLLPFVVLFSFMNGYSQLLTNNNIPITITTGGSISVNGDIQNNAGTVIDNAGSIDLSGNWINNSGNNCFGTSQGLVTFRGTAQSIGGTDSTLFNNLSLVGGTKTLLTNAAVGGGNLLPSGTLDLGLSILDLNSHTLHLTNPNAGIITFGTGYILSEDVDNSSKVNWKINNVTGTHTVPFGNAGGNQIPFTFNLTSGSAGEVTVSTYATAFNNTPFPTAPSLVTHVRNNAGTDNSANTVDRFWQINSTGTPTAALTFSWAVGENAAGGNINPRAQRWVSPALGWEQPIGGQVNPSSQSVLVSNVTAFGPWAVALQSSPLPIELLSFTAVPIKNKEVLCRWITSSEINNDYFTLERSNDAINFEPAGEIDGAGNSTSELSYSFTDQHPFMGVSYYRLKQTDFDGRFTYSDIVAVNFESKNVIITFYPNPASSFTNVSILSNDDIAIESLELVDVTGRIVMFKTVQEGDDSRDFHFDISSFSKGIYTFRVTTGGGFVQKKIIFQ